MDGLQRFADRQATRRAGLHRKLHGMALTFFNLTLISNKVWRGLPPARESDGEHALRCC